MRVVDGWWWNIVEMLIKLVNEVTKRECQQAVKRLLWEKFDEDKME